MVFDVDEYVVFAGFGEEMLVFGEEFDGWFGDHYVDFAFDGIESDWVVSWIWSEDCDCVSRAESIDCFLVGFRVTFIIVWERGEVGVEAVVLHGGAG